MQLEGLRTVDRVLLFPVISSVIWLDDRACMSPLETLEVVALRCYGFRSLMLVVASLSVT